MDDDTKFSVTNIINILCDVTWHDKKRQVHVQIWGATSGKIIISGAPDFLNICVNIKPSYIVVICHYSPYFISTLLSNQDVLLSIPGIRDPSSQ